jgi:hypothetical protein
LTSELRQRAHAAPRAEHGAVDDDKLKTDIALMNTKFSLQSELDRMVATENVLNMSSQGIAEVNSKYGAVGELINSAGGKLKRISERAARDDRMVWLAFLYFLTCVAVVLLRRVGILFLARTLIESLIKLVRVVF